MGTANTPELTPEAVSRLLNRVLDAAWAAWGEPQGADYQRMDLFARLADPAASLYDQPSEVDFVYRWARDRDTRDAEELAERGGRNAER